MRADLFKALQQLHSRLFTQDVRPAEWGRKWLSLAELMMMGGIWWHRVLHIDSPYDNRVTEEERLCMLDQWFFIRAQLNPIKIYSSQHHQSFTNTVSVALVSLWFQQQCCYTLAVIPLFELSRWQWLTGNALWHMSDWANHTDMEVVLRLFFFFFA